jgi:hypothetical protein
MVEFPPRHGLNIPLKPLEVQYQSRRQRLDSTPSLSSYSTVTALTHILVVTTESLSCYVQV